MSSGSVSALGPLLLLLLLHLLAASRLLHAETIGYGEVQVCIGG